MDGQGLTAAAAPAGVAGRPATAGERARALLGARWLPAAVLAVLSLVALALIMYEGRQTIFYFDEWDFVLGRRGTSVGTFLDPHVGHLTLVPVLIYKFLFATVGLEPYWPYRALTAGIHLISVWLLFAIARPRLGVWGAVVVSTLLLFLGWGSEVLLWPFQISYSIPVAAGLGAWLLLRERTTTRDIAASFLLLVGVCSSGVGVPIGLGILVALLVPAGQRSRAWVAIVPLVVYGIWLVAWGMPHDTSDQGGVQLANLPDAPLYMITSASGAAGALGGLSLDFGRVLLGLAAVFAVWRIAVGRISPWLAGAAVAAVAFWGLTALGRADLGIDTASSSRYVYVGAVLILLIALYLDVSWRPSPRAWALIGVATVFAAVGGVAPLRDFGRDLRSISDTVAPAVAAVQIGGDAIPAGTRPELGKAPQIFAGPLREAIAELGSPLPNGVKGLLANPHAADAVDGTLATSEGLALIPPARDVHPGGAAPQVERTINGKATVEGSCVRFAPSRVPSGIDVHLVPGSRLLLRDAGNQPAEVRVRRFGPDFPPNALGTLAAGQSLVLGAPRDTSPTPWSVRLSPATPVAACSA